MHTPLYSLSLRGRLMKIDRPLVMGILNLTPDSFYSPSRTGSAKEAVNRVARMLEEGADIIDIGACSTRPGSHPVSETKELQRLSAPLEEIRKRFPEAVISVDTFRASVARRSLEDWKVDIINDVTGGEDPDMYGVVAEYGAPYILTHSRGDSATMDSLCDYADLMADIVRELAFKVDRAHAAGIADVIVDPGFGFAKDNDQNLQLLAHLEMLGVLGCPILAALSHKRFVKAAAQTPDDSVIPTVVLDTVALMNGASIIRVHDVAEGVITAKIMAKLWNLE